MDTTINKAISRPVGRSIDRTVCRNNNGMVSRTSGRTAGRTGGTKVCATCDKSGGTTGSEAEAWSTRPAATNKNEGSVSMSPTLDAI